MPPKKKIPNDQQQSSLHSFFGVTGSKKTIVQHVEPTKRKEVSQDDANEKNQVNHERSQKDILSEISENDNVTISPMDIENNNNDILVESKKVTPQSLDTKKAKIKATIENTTAKRMFPSENSVSTGSNKKNMSSTASDDDDDVVPSDDDEIIIPVVKKRKQRDVQSKRRVILDDSSDDENDLVTQPVVPISLASIDDSTEKEVDCAATTKDNTKNQQKISSISNKIKISNNDKKDIKNCITSAKEECSQPEEQSMIEEEAELDVTTDDQKKPVEPASTAKTSKKTVPSFFQPKSIKPSKGSKTVNPKGKGTPTDEEVRSNSDVSTSAAAINDGDDCKKKSTDVTPSLTTGGKGQYKSDQEIWESIPENWDDAIPYSVLCKVFGEIEAITGRLQIQDILTNLFRQIILKHHHPSVSATKATANDASDNSNNNNNSKNENSNTVVDDLNTIIYLASNSVAPAYECVELGIGDAILIKAIGEATGTSSIMVKQKYETEGDLGTVAQTCKSKQRTLGGFFTVTQSKSTNGSTTNNTKKRQYLTAADVLHTYRTISKTKGNQAQKFKVDSIKKLLVQASDPIETKYIIRGLQGKLRIGLAQTTVLIALAHAFALSPPVVDLNTSDNIGNEDNMADDADNKQNRIDKTDDSDLPEECQQFVDPDQPLEKRLEAAVVIIKKAYSEVPSYDAIVSSACRVPLQYLHRFCTLTPGVPVAPMLAKPTKSVQEVLKRLTGLKFTIEYKYDGERAQIHLLPDGSTRVFSRNLLDTSEKYPEVPIFVQEAATSAATSHQHPIVQSYVLDAEVVAFNQITGQLVPFQVLSTRKKSEESATSAKVQVIVQVFDLMYLNGQSLLNRTLTERRKLLREYFDPVPNKFQFAQYLDHEENGDTIVIEEFLDQAVKGQCEGLMVKTLDVNANYEPSRRSLNWLKLKKDYLEGLGDSVDLVPLGAYYGKGKRTGVYGAYLLACYDPDTEEFQSVCKIGTGFSDEDLQNLTKQLNEHQIPTKSSQYNVSDQLECDVWFDTVQVWEIKAADLSLSSAHRGAVGKTGEQNSSQRGIGLRFPRFERIRPDKQPEEATTSDQILDMYYEQDSIMAQSATTTTTKRTTRKNDEDDEENDDED